MTDLLSQGSQKFLERESKQPQTISIILPNLIHQSKKRDLSVAPT